MTKPPVFDYFRERDILAQEYSVLVERAGIVKESERCAKRLEPDFFEDRHLPPLFTDAFNEAQKRQDESKFQSYRHCQRQVVFNVADRELRRQLIAAERKFQALKIKSCQKDLEEAQKRLREVGKNDISGMFAALGAGILVVLAWHTFGAEGALAVAVFSMISAMYGVSAQKRKIKQNTLQVSKEISDFELALNEQIEKEVFSLVEEDTGDPSD
jgi:hypothetical protein